MINGSKTFISNGQLSDAVIVVAKTDVNAKRAAHGLSLFLVDTGTAGYTKGKALNKLGLKAQDTSELFFQDCRVPATAMLGQLNRGFYQLMEQLPQERLLLGVIGGVYSKELRGHPHIAVTDKPQSCLFLCSLHVAVAHAEACYEWTRHYVKERKAFGG